MSQVQIRQMPITSQQIAGSWFSTGYHGHSRAKPRVDISNRFRQLAQPDPPKKFVHRQNSEASSHMFSQHDNRFKFENDPLVRGTQAGFGKRKPQKNTRGVFDPFFISWIPDNFDREKYIDDIKKTSYTNDYSGLFTSSQILSDTESITSSPPSEVSVYSSVYNHGQPDSQKSKQIRQEAFRRYASTQTRRSKLQPIERNLNVASCLVWNNTDHENDKPKMNDKSINIFPPTTLKSRHSFHAMPAISEENPYRSQSLKTFITMEEPSSGATTFREHPNVEVIPPIQGASLLEQLHTNSMESLISKYM